LKTQEERQEVYWNTFCISIFIGKDIDIPLWSLTWLK